MILDRDLPSTATGAIPVLDEAAAIFASAGVGDSGILLMADVGAAALRFEDLECVQRFDGMGWLLGDVGSATWLGLRTVEAVAADIDRRTPRTALTEHLGDALGLDLRDGLQPLSPTGDVRRDLIREIEALVPDLSPVALGRFAPLPGQVPEDPAARRILDIAVRNFAEEIRRLDPQRSLPVVLAGSVFADPGPIRDELECWIEADGRDLARTNLGTTPLGGAEPS